MIRAPKQQKASMRPYGLAVTLAFVFAGCASTPSDPPFSSATSTVAPVQSEQATASQRENARILASYGGSYEDPRLQALVEKIITRLAEASERPGLKYQITILNSPAINAFSLPNGELYVTRGLIALTNNEAELASVLAHEIGHVIAQHAAIREEQARQAAIVNLVANEILSDPEAGALALAKSKLALANFSRAQEFEADGLGIQLAARAGYDAYGTSRFLTSMQRNADLQSSANNSPHSLFDFLSQHPATPDRVQNALANARQLNNTNRIGESDQAAYLSLLDGVVYGDDENQGFVRGRRFASPKLGFSFTVPEGFTLTYTAKTVLGINADGTKALRIDMAHVPAEQNLADYLKLDSAGDIDPQSAETLTIEGLTASTLTAKSEQWFYRLYAIRVGGNVYRFRFADKNYSAAADRSLREAIMSFHRMSMAERDRVKPRRVKIISVKAGDTPEKLARRMAGTDHPVELFRVLNALSPHDRLKPGQQVKIVVAGPDIQKPH